MVRLLPNSALEWWKSYWPEASCANQLFQLLPSFERWLIVTPFFGDMRPCMPQAWIVKQGQAASRKNQRGSWITILFFQKKVPTSTHQQRGSWKNLHSETKKCFLFLSCCQRFLPFFLWLPPNLLFFVPPRETFPQEVATNTAMRCTGIAEPKRPNTCRPEHPGIGVVVDLLTIEFLVNGCFYGTGFLLKMENLGKQRGVSLLFQKNMISNRCTRCMWIRCIIYKYEPHLCDSFPRAGSRYRRGVLQSSISLIHLQIHRVFASTTSAAHAKGRELLVLALVEKGRNWSSP